MNITRRMKYILRQTELFYCLSSVIIYVVTLDINRLIMKNKNGSTVDSHVKQLSVKHLKQLNTIQQSCTL